jgi:hypothetical protein
VRRAREAREAREAQESAEARTHGDELPQEDASAPEDTDETKEQGR